MARPTSLLVLVATWAGALAWACAANAEPDFPAAVDGFLMKNGLVEQTFPNTNPKGCDLCHQNGASGGKPLTAFGASLQITDTSPTPSELNAALDRLAGSRALEDLKMGMDPNQDTLAFSSDSTPQYGCGSIAAGRPTSGGGATPVWLALAALWGLRKRRPPTPA
jgi:hypothetical protein